MSKIQKSNKENKKPKAEKNRVRAISPYKVAQGQGKPASSRFGKIEESERHSAGGLSAPESSLIR
jgi:hypothetical protein